MRPKTLPKSLLGEVTAFIWCPWSRLFVFITVGRVGMRDRKCGHRSRSEDCKDGEGVFQRWCRWSPSFIDALWRL